VGGRAVSYPADAAAQGIELGDGTGIEAPTCARATSAAALSRASRTRHDRPPSGLGPPRRSAGPKRPILRRRTRAAAVTLVCRAPSEQGVCLKEKYLLYFAPYGRPRRFALGRPRGANTSPVGEEKRASMTARTERSRGVRRQREACERGRRQANAASAVRVRAGLHKIGIRACDRVRSERRRSASPRRRARPTEEAKTAE
jgi:hypothetical protein